MRVISGKAKGTKISSIESISTRPTLDRVKESLFNILQENINGAYVLDLFAGSGALGIEALSRNALRAVLCDINKEAATIIKNNLEKTRLIEKAKIFNTDYKQCLNQLSKDKNNKFDLVFLDPPYKLDLAINSLKILVEKGLLNNNSIVVIETDEINRDLLEINGLIEKLKTNNSNCQITLYDQRKYGRANLMFLKYEFI